ncbi:MAG TPA: hypothetical protein CFH79_01620 [Sulfurospirillum sp. UBA11407]|nr:MAG TPA: hypothetical protein CFH79_01620 [Sulfurospirillum sp. UBA11407]
MKKSLKTKLYRYRFTQEDALILRKSKRFAEKNLEKFARDFSEFIFEFDSLEMLFEDKKVFEVYEISLRNWFLSLFSGVYDEKYFKKLYMIREAFVKTHLPSCYVNAFFSYIRVFLKEMLIKQKRYNALSSLDRILDINFDILTITTNPITQTKLLKEALFLKKCVDDRAIVPYFQPIYSACKTEPIKYESLMRLVDEKNQKIDSAFAYLEVAKKIKLYKKMTRIMVEKVFEYFHDKDANFSLNICYTDIEDKNFCDYVTKKIKKFPYPKNIVFEIVESDCLKDFTIVENFVSTMRQYGCKIAIDDFGSGFSSMENILKLKPEYIKIDGSLIKNLDISEGSRMIVEAIVNMSKGFHAKTIAEYVESEMIQDIVISLGVDYLQGYYLGKPKPYM